MEAGVSPANVPERAVVQHTPMRAVADPAEAGSVDLVLVCVKSYDTGAAAAALRPMVAPETIVLSLQNGIENEAILAAALGLPPLLGGLTHIGAELVAPGVVRHDSGGRIIFGELDGRRSARARTAGAALRPDAGIAHHLSRPHRRDAVGQAGLERGLQRLHGGGAADGRRAAGAHRRARAGAGGDAGGGRGGERRRRGRSTPRASREIERSAAELGHLRTSMLQDRERGRRLEHDALNGAVVRAADRDGVRRRRSTAFCTSFWQSWIDAPADRRTAPPP